MSGALYFYFWDDWAGTPAPTPSPSPTPAPPIPSPMPGPDLNPAGGGHNRHDVAIPPDLWDVRERYLRSLFNGVTRPPPSPIEVENDYAEYDRNVKELEAAASERASMIISMRRAPTVSTMKLYGAKIKELNATIATLQAKLNVKRLLRK